MSKWAGIEIERRWGDLAQSHIIGRTERVKALKRLLQENRILYLSSFFWSGKTVLLDQLARRLPGKALRFNVGDDDWAAFAASVEAAGDCVLLIDSLQRADHVTEEALAALLANLKEGQRAVLAGRAQLPVSLRALSIGGGLEVLGLDFVLFDEEEIRQLFLEYGIVLKGADVTWLKQMGQGWPLLMHIIARRSQQDPGRPVRDMRDVVPELWDMLLRNVLVDFPEPERILLYSLSPFESFSEDMARMVTGRQDAPAMMSDIAQKSYMLMRERDGRYSFIPLVRGALFHEMRNRYTQSYIDGQYKRAALYYELNGRLTEAIEYYMALGETEKIRELLIRDSRLRPSNGEYVELKRAYDMLPAETIEGSPELMKGICMIESLSGRVAQSEYWYERLERYVHSTPARDAQRRTAQEALAYLDIALPHRGAGRMLRTLISTAKLGSFVHSQSWRIGFNVAGNSVSLLNGGKDFSRWVPHGRALYRLFKPPVERALGRGGSGMADIAIAECELESSLDGDYGAAMNGICRSMTGVSDDLEMRCAAIGIQSRIMMARGDLADAQAHRRAAPGRAEALAAEPGGLPADAGADGGGHRRGHGLAGAFRPGRAAELHYIGPLPIHAEAAAVHHQGPVEQNPAAGGPAGDLFRAVRPALYAHTAAPYAGGDRLAPGHGGMARGDGKGALAGQALSSGSRHRGRGHRRDGHAV